MRRRAVGVKASNDNDPGEPERSPSPTRGGHMITLAEQIAEAQRELALRKKCYPQWIKSGKLDAGDAKYQLLVQEEIVRTLLRLDAEQRQLSLFATHD